MNILAKLLGILRYLLYLYKKWTDKPYPDDLRQKTKDEFIRKIRDHNRKDDK